MTTSISGFQTREEAERERRRISETLNDSAMQLLFPFIEGGENLKWNIRTCVLADGSSFGLQMPDDDNHIIIMRRETILPWREYYPQEEHEWLNKYWFNGKEEFTFFRNMAVFLPHHHLLLDLRDPSAEKFFNNKRDQIKYLGYNRLKSINKPTDPYLKMHPTAEDSFLFNHYYLDQIDVLYKTRKSKSLRAFDTRAQEIVSTLIDNIPNGDKLTYSIALYKLRIIKELDLYLNEEEEIELGLKKIIEINGEEIKKGKLEEICKSIPPSFALGIKSPVFSENEKYHIPMMDFFKDFSFSQDSDNSFMRYLDEELSALNMDGMLVDSGNSGHFYGFKLLTQNQWENFMQATNRMWITDKKFVEIQKKVDQLY